MCTLDCINDATQSMCYVHVHMSGRYILSNPETINFACHSKKVCHSFPYIFVGLICSLNPNTTAIKHVLTFPSLIQSSSSM